jgi:hypothetical protein
MNFLSGFHRLLDVSIEQQSVVGRAAARKSVE